MKRLPLTIEKRKKALQHHSAIFSEPPTPIIFSAEETTNFEETFERFLTSAHIVTIHDTYESQLEELFHLRHPALVEGSREFHQKKEIFFTEQAKGIDFSYHGSWVYYPWTERLVHFLPHDLHQEIRTARNKLLITPTEQEKFRRTVVGIGGMSIGNSVALSLAYSGGCEVMKLADPDVFSASNLNRVRIPAYYLGVKKVFVAAQQIYEVNPYAKLTLFPEGITGENIDSFINGENRLDILVDELDNLKVKLILRFIARAEKLPLVMTTDNGDDALLDIDRFDLHDIQPFSDFPQMDLQTILQTFAIDETISIPAEKRAKMASVVVGPEKIAPRMQESLMEVGKSLVSWPQLGTAAFLGGAALAYVIKKIALGEEVVQGKVSISLDHAILKGYTHEDGIKNREKMTKKFLTFLQDGDIPTLDSILKPKS